MHGFIAQYDAIMQKSNIWGIFLLIYESHVAEHGEIRNTSN